jgi:hypothetical protein
VCRQVWQCATASLSNGNLLWAHFQRCEASEIPSRCLHGLQSSMLGKGWVVDEGVGELERWPQSAAMRDCAVDGEAGTGTGDSISKSLASGEEDMFGRWVLLLLLLIGSARSRYELFVVFAIGEVVLERASLLIYYSIFCVSVSN